MTLVDISKMAIPQNVNFTPFYQNAGPINTNSGFTTAPAYSNSTNQPVTSYPQKSSVLGASTSAQPAAPAPAPHVQAPAPTGGGGGGGGGGTDYASTLARMKAGQQQWDDNLLAQLQKSAQSGNDATMQAIQEKLNLVRGQAQQQIQNAQGTRDYVTNFINTRYPELQNRVEQQRTNALQDLGTQQTGLQNLYDQANATARRRAEDVALQNRMTARAGNRLGSSFYDQAVQSNQENLGRTLGASDLERIAKMAGIDTQKTRTNQDFNNTINDLDTQKNQAMYSALDEYNKAVQEANYLSNAGLADFGASQAQATQNLQSRLDSIAQWAQGMAQQKQALDAQYGTNGSDGTIGTRLADIGNQNASFLTQNAQTPAGSHLQNISLNTLALPQTATGNQYAYANQGLSKTDDILRQLGLA
jgi:hypothetical protein